MKALEVFAIYVTPFLIVGAAIRFLMKRYAVDCLKSKSRPAPNQGADFSWVPGETKTKAASIGGLLHTRNFRPFGTVGT